MGDDPPAELPEVCLEDFPVAPHVPEGRTWCPWHHRLTPETEARLRREAASRGLFFGSMICGPCHAEWEARIRRRRSD